MAEKNSQIRLKESTYDLWCQRKVDFGFEGVTHSEFAELLLHNYNVHASINIDSGSDASPLHDDGEPLLTVSSGSRKYSIMTCDLTMRILKGAMSYMRMRTGVQQT